MGARWGNVCARHLESGEKAHQGGRTRQGIELVALVVETQPLQASQSSLILLFTPHLSEADGLNTPSIEGQFCVDGVGDSARFYLSVCRTGVEIAVSVRLLSAWDIHCPGAVLHRSGWFDADLIHSSAESLH